MNESPEFLNRDTEKILSEYLSALNAIDRYIQALDEEGKRVLRTVAPHQATFDTYLDQPIEELAEQVQDLIEGDTFNAVGIVTLREALAKKVENLRLVPGR